jgi:hypothetical protein
MEGLTLGIYDWLTELEEHEAAEFISNCQIENFYLDTLFFMDSDKEMYMYEVTVFVPLKTFKKLVDFVLITNQIESAINELADSQGMCVKNIEWKPMLKSSVDNQNEKRGEIISDFLDQNYIKKQLRLLNRSINDNPHLAIGASKELIESCCKYILNKARIPFNQDWDILKLVKETNKSINLIPFELENKELAITSVSKILGGFATIVHGVIELRNAYGSGHGHEPNFKMLDEIYVKLAVSSARELAVFYLSIDNLKENTSSS